jgi:hypothetical protein
MRLTTTSLRFVQFIQSVTLDESDNQGACREEELRSSLPRTRHSSNASSLLGGGILDESANAGSKSDSESFREMRPIRPVWTNPTNAPSWIATDA